jgi:hypothetical protein
VYEKDINSTRKKKPQLEKYIVLVPTFFHIQEAQCDIETARPFSEANVIIEQTAKKRHPSVPVRTLPAEQLSPETMNPAQQQQHNSIVLERGKELIAPSEANFLENNDAFPSSLVSQAAGFHWIYWFRLLSSESNIVDQKEVLTSEVSIIKRSHIQMGANIGRLKYTIAKDKLSQKICTAYCKGAKRDGCCKHVKYQWVKGEKEIACYLHAEKDVQNWSKISHHPTCRQSAHDTRIPETLLHDLRKSGFKSKSKHLSVAKSIMDSAELSSMEKKNMMFRSQARMTSNALNNYAYDKKRKARDLNKNTTSD